MLGPTPRQVCEFLVFGLVCSVIGNVLYGCQKSQAVTSANQSVSPVAVAPVTSTPSAPQPIAPVAPPVSSVPNPWPTAPPVSAAPSVPELDYPPVAVTPSGPGPLDAMPMDAAPLPSGWTEVPSAQEMPTIVFQNNSATHQLTLSLIGDTGRYSLGCPPLSQRQLQLPPGEYAYALLGPYYQATATYDLAGTFRCRRFRRYVVPFYTAPAGDMDGAKFEDLGDPN